MDPSSASREVSPERTESRQPVKFVPDHGAGGGAETSESSAYTLPPPPATAAATVAPSKEEVKSVLSAAAKSALLSLSVTGKKLDADNLGESTTSGSGGNKEDQSKTVVELSREHISRKLLALMEEDAKKFTEMDIKELMPSSPYEDKSFDKLKEFFDSVIAELISASHVGIPLEEVKEEFQSLWEGIQKSHRSLNGLMRNDVHLSVEVAESMVKTRNLIQVAENHPDVIEKLGGRLEKAWNLLDVSEEDEKRNAAKIEEYKTDIMILNRNILAATGMEGHQELSELQEIRRKLQEDRDSATNELGKMKTSFTLGQEKKLRLIEKKTEYMDTITYCIEETTAQKEAFERETERKERIQDDIDMLTTVIEKKTNDITEIERYSFGTAAKLGELNGNINAQKVINDAVSKEADAACDKLSRVNQEFNAQINRVEKLGLDIFRKQNELRDKELEIEKLNREGMLIVRQNKGNSRRVVLLQERLDELEGNREALKGKIVDLEKDLQTAQEQLEENRKNVHELDRKRTRMSQNLTRANEVANQTKNRLKYQLLVKSNLDKEREAYKRDIYSQMETMTRLDRERDFYANEAIKLARELSQKMDEIKKMDTFVFDFKMKISNLEGVVKSRHQEYEQSLLESRFFEKLLRDAGRNIISAQTEVRHKTFELNTEIFSYFEQQGKYKKQKNLLEYLIRESQFFTMEAIRVRKMAVDMGRQVDALMQERSILGCGCAEASNELAKQRYYATRAQNRMQNYNRRLQNKSNELKKTWEKWIELHSMVRIGAYHYRNVMAEIRATRMDIVKLRRLQNKFTGTFNHNMAFQQEISTLETSISKETCMVIALEDELNRPINIHRWRVLEAIDPEAYDAVKKINTLTKRMVEKNAKIQKQTASIANKESIYVDMRHAILRLPCLETPELKEHYEILVSRMQERAKCLKQDLYTTECRKEFYRKEVIRLNHRLGKVREWFLAEHEAYWWYLQDPDHRAFCGDVDYFNYVRAIREDFPIEKIDFTALDMVNIRETFKTHQIQQDAVEKCFARRKVKVQKKKDDPEYDSDQEGIDLFEERYGKDLNGRAPGSLEPDDESQMTGLSISSFDEEEDLTDHIVKQAFTQNPPEKKLVQKWFPEIKTQVSAEEEKAQRWKAIIDGIGGGGGGGGGRGIHRR